MTKKSPIRVTRANTPSDDLVGFLSSKMKGKVFRDKGLLITMPASTGGIVHQISPKRRGMYRVLDVVGRAPWNPNQLRTTLEIEYSDEPGIKYYTYMDERFRDTSLNA